MFKILIRGLKDGDYEIEMNGKGETIEFICPEFQSSEINISGNMKVLGNKYTISATLSSIAYLTCDISLEEYKEEVEVPFVLSYIADDELFALNEGDGNLDERIIKSDQKEIDITDEVRELLCINLPMKRVAPQYRGKEFSEIHPELSSDASLPQIDDRWAKLKDIKLN